MDALLTGKRCSQRELERRMKKVADATELKNFIPLFCRYYNFQQFPHEENIVVDYVIDLDVLKVYKPTY